MDSSKLNGICKTYVDRQGYTTVGYGSYASASYGQGGIDDAFAISSFPFLAQECRGDKGPRLAFSAKGDGGLALAFPAKAGSRQADNPFFFFLNGPLDLVDCLRNLSSSFPPDRLLVRNDETEEVDPYSQAVAAEGKKAVESIDSALGPVAFDREAVLRVFAAFAFRPADYLVEASKTFGLFAYAVGFLSQEGLPLFKKDVRFEVADGRMIIGIGSQNGIAPRPLPGLDAGLDQAADRDEAGLKAFLTEVYSGYLQADGKELPPELYRLLNPRLPRDELARGLLASRLASLAPDVLISFFKALLADPALGAFLYREMYRDYECFSLISDHPDILKLFADAIGKLLLQAQSGQAALEEAAEFFHWILEDIRRTSPGNQSLLSRLYRGEAAPAAFALSIDLGLKGYGNQGESAGGAAIAAIGKTFADPEKLLAALRLSDDFYVRSVQSPFGNGIELSRVDEGHYADLWNLLKKALELPDSALTPAERERALDRYFVAWQGASSSLAPFVCQAILESKIGAVHSSDYYAIEAALNENERKETGRPVNENFFPLLAAFKKDSLLVAERTKTLQAVFASYIGKEKELELTYLSFGKRARKRKGALLGEKASFLNLPFIVFFVVDLVLIALSFFMYRNAYPLLLTVVLALLYIENLILNARFASYNRGFKQGPFYLWMGFTTALPLAVFDLVSLILLLTGFGF